MTHPTRNTTRRIVLAALAAALTLLSACTKEDPIPPDENSSSSSSTPTVQLTPTDDAAGGPNTAGYWIARLSDADAVLMTADEIAAYNAALAADGASTRCVDLAAHADALTKAELTALLDEQKTPEDERYIGSSKATAAYYQKLTANMNKAGVKEQNPVRYAFAARNTGLRTFPTGDASYEFPDDKEFDLFAETVLKVFEPLVALHTSADGTYTFVQTRNYRGWALTADLAFAADKSEWTTYQSPARFLVVSGNRVTLNENIYNETAAGLELFMGTVLPLVDASSATIDGMTADSGYVVALPGQEKGKLRVVQALVPWNADVREGFMPYTQANILRQAFKLCGDRLGWSGLNKSRDSTSLVMDVFASFGFHLPRNSAQQAAIPGEDSALSGSDTEKAAAIAALRPGSLLTMNGHVALYVGEEGGTPYALHALYVAYDAAKNQRMIDAIVVTDLSLCDKDGQSYLAGMAQGKFVRG